MERLTSISSIGGLAFNFDLEVTCDRSEIDKILKIGARLKEYEDTNLTPDQFKELNKLYLEKCEEVNRLNEKQIPKKIIAEQWIYTKCECGKTFSIGGYDGYYRVPHENRTKYCSDCGQRLDWSVEK